MGPRSGSRRDTTETGTTLPSPKTKKVTKKEKKSQPENHTTREPLRTSDANGAHAAISLVQPVSCTHIAGQCKTHNDKFIKRHNAACQLTYEDQG